ncbi:MAG: 2-oxoglutarate dehydrogenase, component, dihydrolipoamide succinyltransferase [Frankiales bacterium]|nr:2-oxoglutarate dehydrogenase, component, dihydrolipoamide succinyltransferase [Frankiales bacterium]
MRTAPDGSLLTPMVLKLTAELDVDLASVRGTGAGGRVRQQDVRDAAAGGQPSASAPSTPSPGAPGRSASAAPAARPSVAVRPASPPAAPTVGGGETRALSRLRKVIATRMVHSLQVSAQLTTVLEVDITAVARLREAAKRDFLARHGSSLTFLPFMAVAAVEALKVHRNVNASLDLDAGTATYYDAVHLGIAVDTERGLLVPVVRDADSLNLAGISRRINDLAERTRSGTATADELAGGTFTITNTGSRGALFDTPIINQPQVGILGVGAVVERPVVVQHAELGKVVALRSMVYLALTYDHRIVDGADAARFLTTMKDRLEGGAFGAELGL